MFKIAVCDDETYFQNCIKEILMTYQKEKGVLFEIDIFSSGAELISLGINLAQYKIVFLDINMSELDGILTAKEIRKISNAIFIVFVTAFVNYSLEGYKVDAIRYILKHNENLTATVYECMDAIFEKMNYKITWKEIRFLERCKKVPLDRILYIESKLHKLEFFIMEDRLEKYTLYETLDKIEKDFAENNFIRIHQSFLINMKYISNIKRYCLTLNNGAAFHIPRARYKKVEAAFITYKGEL